MKARQAGLGMQVRIAGVRKHGVIRGLSWEEPINYSLKAETGRLLAGRAVSALETLTCMSK